MIEKGCVVISTAGRDKDRAFIVLETLERGYCLVADGKLRRVQNPKKKKIKHLDFRCACELPAALKIREGVSVTDAELRKALAITLADEDCSCKEG